MLQKITRAYDNLFMSINSCTNETILDAHDNLVGLFVDNYQDTITPEDQDAWTEMRVVLRSALKNRRRWLEKQMEDYINTNAIIAEAMKGEEGIIFQQFNDTK